MITKLLKNKGALLFLAVVSLILILPAIIYQYPYPSISDDVPAYLQVVEKVAHGELSDADSYRFCYPTNIFGGESCNYRNAAPAFIGLICRVLHSDPYWTYYVFHYLALIGIALCVWLFCRKVFNKLTGYLGVLFVMFGATPLLRYSFYDQIFNITNLLVFGLMGCLALIYWLKTKRFYYALISMMLFMIAVLFHSSTGLEIYICVGFFLVSTVIYKAFRRAEVLSVGIYLSVFTLICGALIFTLNLEARGLFGAVVSGASVSVGGIHSVVPVYYFFTQDTSLLLLIFGAFGFWYVLRKKIAPVGLWMLLSFIFVFVVSILINRFEPARSAQDLGIILLLFYAGAMGTALYHTRTLPKIINASKTIIFIVLVACVPTLYGWFQYHCAITPIDQQAIAEINKLGGTWNCSTQINPSVYDLFINAPYVITGADYTIYRSQRQTAATDPNNRYTIVQGNESKISDYELSRVATYYSEEVTIIIFRRGND